MPAHKTLRINTNLADLGRQIERIYKHKYTIEFFFKLLE